MHPSEASAKSKSGSSRPEREVPRGLKKSEQPLVNPRWLFGSLLGVLLFAAICVYGAICLLFWQGQWQLVFGPSQAVSATPAALGLKYDDIHFEATETGILQLDGWWIPANAGSIYSGNTILFLRDGSGSLSDSVAELGTLHALGINIFAFDYRGFGSSAKIHPSEKSVLQDAEAAWQYLAPTRHIDPGTIAIYGYKLGAAVAAELAVRHPQTRAVVLEDLRPPVLQRLGRDGRTRFLPMRLLFHDRFDPTPALSRLATPKLLLSGSSSEQTRQNGPSYDAIAAEPKVIVVLHSAPGAQLYQDPSYATALDRFLKKYLLESPK